MGDFIKVEIDLDKSNLNTENLQKRVLIEDKKLLDKTGDGNDFLGWLDVKNIVSKDEIKEIKDRAKHFQAYEK